MKTKITVILLAALLLCTGGLGAFAAPGDTVQFNKSWMEENLGSNQYLQDGLLVENTFYTLFSSALYAYTFGEEEPRLLNTFLPNKEENLYFRDLEAAKEHLG